MSIVDSYYISPANSVYHQKIIQPEIIVPINSPDSNIELLLRQIFCPKDDIEKQAALRNANLNTLLTCCRTFLADDNPMPYNEEEIKMLVEVRDSVALCIPTNKESITKYYTEDDHCNNSKLFENEILEVPPVQVITTDDPTQKHGYRIVTHSNGSQSHEKIFRLFQRKIICVDKFLSLRLSVPNLVSGSPELNGKAIEILKSVLIAIIAGLNAFYPSEYSYIFEFTESKIPYLHVVIRFLAMKYGANGQLKASSLYTGHGNVILAVKNYINHKENTQDIKLLETPEEIYGEINNYISKEAVWGTQVRYRSTRANFFEGIPTTNYRELPYPPISRSPKHNL